MARSAMQRLILAGVMLGTQGIGRADMCPIKGLVEKSPKVFGFAQFDQSTECSIRVCGGRVDKEPGLILVVVNLRVNSLSNASGVIPALECEFSDQHVREGVMHHIARTGIAFVRIQISFMAPTAMSQP